MKTIWKFPIPIQDGIIEVSMPQNAEILHVGNQRETLCLWALVESEVERENRKFRIYGTGHKMLPNIDTPYNTYDSYIGTAMMHGGTFVWHVFEVK